MKTDWMGVGFGIALILMGAVPPLLFKPGMYTTDRKRWGMTDQTFDKLMGAFCAVIGVLLVILGVYGK